MEKKLLHLESDLEEQICDYLKKNATEDKLKECTCSKMAKRGALRAGGVTHSHLKKVLGRLEGRGIISSIKVKDDIRNIEYIYYKIGATAPGEKGEIPTHIRDNENIYRSVIAEYYKNISSNYYFPIEATLCQLCEKWGEVLNIKGCGLFLELYQNIGKKPTEIRNLCNRLGNEKELNLPSLLNLSDEKINKLKKIADKWCRQRWPSPVFLEDLTITLLGFIICQAPSMVKCLNCKNNKKDRSCLRTGQNWVKDFLGEFIDDIPKNKLTEFWQGILSKDPEIRPELLYEYFSERYALEEETHNCFLFLDYYRKIGGEPFLCTKAIPLAVGWLVEGVILPTIKENFDSVYVKYAGQLKQ